MFYYKTIKILKSISVKMIYVFVVSFGLLVSAVMALYKAMMIEFFMSQLSKYCFVHSFIVDDITSQWFFYVHSFILIVSYS